MLNASRLLLPRALASAHRLRLLLLALPAVLAACGQRSPGSELFPLDSGHRWTYDVKTEWDNNIVGFSRRQNQKVIPPGFFPVLCHHLDLVLERDACLLQLAKLLLLLLNVPIQSIKVVQQVIALRDDQQRLALQRVKAFQKVARPLQIGLPGIRQRDISGRAIEQSRAQPVLQTGHKLRDLGARDTQLSRPLREAARVGDRGEGADLVQSVHQTISRSAA